MKTYKIYPIYAGEAHEADGFVCAYVCYLIEGDGVQILVDSGPCNNEMAAKYHNKKMVMGGKNSAECLVESLAKHGVKPEDIKTMILTHLHWDHIYNCDLFPNARMYVQQNEVKFALDPPPTHYVYYEAFQAGMTPKWISFINQLETVDGDYELCEGIKLVTLPGHSPGFQGVLVNTEAGRYLIASDSVPFLRNWENRLFGLPTPSGIYTDTVTYYESIRKMLAISNYVLPGHDPRAFEKEVYP